MRDAVADQKALRRCEQDVRDWCEKRDEAIHSACGRGSEGGSEWK